MFAVTGANLATAPCTRMPFGADALLVAVPTLQEDEQNARQDARELALHHNKKRKRPKKHRSGAHVNHGTSHLKHLQSLDMQRNQLTKLPPGIAGLHCLTALHLQRNNFSKLDCDLRPLVNLRSLHLQKNRFDHFPLNICMIQSLEQLDLSDNEITGQLPDALCNQCANLRWLNMTRNCLKKLVQTPSSIGHLLHLHTLLCRDNEISERLDTLAFQPLQHLEVLEFCGNAFTRQDIKHMTKQLELVCPAVFF